MGKAIETVDKFTFLGSSVPAMIADDVQRRINLAAWAFGRLRDKIWSNQNISRTIKVRIYKALILPIATYGSESWTLRKMDKNKLEVFVMRCLRTIAGVKLCDRVRNVDIRRELHIDKTITQEINKRQLTWFGHVARMLTPDTHTKHTNMISQRQDHVDVPRWDGKIRSGASQNYPLKRQSIKPRIGLIGEGFAIGKQGDTQSCAPKSSKSSTNIQFKIFIK